MCPVIDVCCWYQWKREESREWYRKGHPQGRPCWFQAPPPPSPALEWSCLLSQSFIYKVHCCLWQFEKIIKHVFFEGVRWFFGLQAVQKPSDGRSRVEILSSKQISEAALEVKTCPFVMSNQGSTKEHLTCKMCNCKFCGFSLWGSCVFHIRSNESTTSSPWSPPKLLCSQATEVPWKMFLLPIKG